MGLHYALFHSSITFCIWTICLLCSGNQQGSQGVAVELLPCVARSWDWLHAIGRGHNPHLASWPGGPPPGWWPPPSLPASGSFLSRDALHELFQDHLPPASANPPPTTQGAATSSLHRGCSRLTGKADPLPSSGSGSGPQEERPIWSKMTLQTSGKLPQRPSEPPMTPAAAAMLPTLLQDITVLLERQCGFHWKQEWTC